MANGSGQVNTMKQAYVMFEPINHVMTAIEAASFHTRALSTISLWARGFFAVSLMALLPFNALIKS